MLPIGQPLWLKELETYKKFPPLQDPASYNLDQVMEQVKKAPPARRATSRVTDAMRMRRAPHGASALTTKDHDESGSHSERSDP